MKARFSNSSALVSFVKFSAYNADLIKLCNLSEDEKIRLEYLETDSKFKRSHARIAWEKTGTAEKLCSAICGTETDIFKQDLPVRNVIFSKPLNTLILVFYDGSYLEMTIHKNYYMIAYLRRSLKSAFKFFLGVHKYTIKSDQRLF